LSLTTHILPPLSSGYFKPCELFASVLYIAKKPKINSGLWGPWSIWITALIG